MGTIQPPDEFRLEDWAIAPPWLNKRGDEKPQPSQASNVVSFDEYRRAREKQRKP
jgi:hypothetical protein